jgi:hypothetical protein
MMLFFNYDICEPALDFFARCIVSGNCALTQFLPRPSYPVRRYEGGSYIPATHGLQIEKPHWQPSSAADRYVICLLRKGYRWEDRGESAVGRDRAGPLPNPLISRSG